MKFKGFTLAEVLITLAIIGIVAALTIPSVISNYQQQEFKTGLKKAVSVLNEAIQTNIAQDGETPYENDDLFTYLQRHMSVMDRGLLWKIEYNYNEVFANGNHPSIYYRNKFFYVSDGMRFEMDDYIRRIKLHETGNEVTNERNIINEYGVTSTFSGICGSYGLENNPNNTIYPPCIITVDVNGDKKPNPPVSAGENKEYDYSYPSPTDKKLTDVFNILITEDRAIPFGVVAQRAMYSK